MLLLWERELLLRRMSHLEVIRDTGTLRHFCRCTYDHNPLIDIGMGLALGFVSGLGFENIMQQLMS